MLRPIFFLSCMIWGLSLLAQPATKANPPENPIPTGFQISTFDPAVDLAAGVPRAARVLPAHYQYRSLPTLPRPGREGRLRVTARAENGMPLYIEGRLSETDSQAPLARQADVFLTEAAPLLGIADPATELIPGRQSTDDLGFNHLRVSQMYQGLPVYGGELVLHARAGQPYLLNGRVFPTPELTGTSPGLDGAAARALALADLSRQTTVRELTEAERAIAHDPEAAPELIVYHHGLDLQSERLAWHIRLVPNVVEHWEYFVDAHTGEILNQFRASCTLRPTGLPTPPPGPTTAQAQDLKGINRTINVYEDGGTYFMIDASRPMYNPAQSDIPSDPAGAIWTIDGQGSNPFSGSLNAVQVFSNNNNWNNNPLAVSAHYNAGQAYEYFRGRFNRNSINGSGGNVVSVINVNEETGEEMDNAFWNGFAMFYGNGNTFFDQPLARSLDVAGHEMSHGVIQNTANLIYQNQPGALNESFADVFGVLIDPTNYQLGEDVVDDNFYPTGALRDMADPNNGGNSLSDAGWQPAHMDEFQNLSSNQDNGGVHINSGIPNRAFYLFASEIGRPKAEQVYYRALDNYLTSSSQFVDCRLAVIQAAADLHGSGSTEATAAANAFAAVGIGQGSGSGGQDDLETNEGQDYILATDETLSGLYLFDWQGVDQISTSGVLSRPSITDDGSIIVFVAGDNTLRAMIRNNQTGVYEESFIENNPQQIWRNITISKDGTRIAMLTTDYNNVVEIYDYVSATGTTFELRNPTTAPGGVIYTDDVAYADVLEWDYTGEFLLYDALTQLGTTGGGEYWDIGMIQVWDNGGQSFADGFTFKLFSSLPAGSSVGNPTFAKNSPYIIAFDFIGDTEQLTEITILGANVETGDVDEIYYNGDVLGVPNYSVEDDQLIFNNYDFFDGPSVDRIDLAGDKIRGVGEPTTILNGGQYGVWFATGERELVSTASPAEQAFDLRARPNPFGESLQLIFNSPLTGDGQLVLYDQLGRKVYEQPARVLAGENNLELAIPGLPTGIYTARLLTPLGWSAVRVIKQ